MLNKTYTAISQAINLIFGTDYQIIIDQMNQVLDTPYFYIKVLNPSQTQKLGNQYERIQPFDIQYFPNSEQYTTECMEVAEKLFDTLEYITLDSNIIRGTSMNFKVEDGILHFFVHFNMIVLKQNNADLFMNDVEKNIGLKEGE